MNGHRFMSLLLLLFAGANAVVAQNDPAFKKWQEEQNTKLKDFKDANDRAFHEFLKKEWRGVNLARGLVKDTIPDPVALPVYQGPKREQPSDAPAAPPVVVPPPPRREVRSIPVSPPPPVGVDVEYFGAKIPVPIRDEMRVPVNGNPGKESIAEFFAGMSRVSFDDVLRYARDFRASRHLNDWGYCLFLNAIGERLYGPSSDGATLYVWYLLLKSGFDAKVGFTASRIMLLLPSEERLFGVPFFSFGPEQRRYYAVTLNPRRPIDDLTIYSYEGSYPTATRQLKFAVASIPVLSNQVASKTLTFTMDGVQHHVPLRYSRDAVSFFEYYPQTDFVVYFDGSISDDAASTLYAAFTPMLAGMSEIEAVNMLLRFSQTAFGYKVDKELFGREKPMFPDEVLYYDFSNCKDRAILFAYLVRRLTGLEVVGLDYPGHISTAIRFTRDVAGEAVIVQGRKFVICDPTYINAVAGMCMPQFRGVDPKIIVLRKP